MASFKYTIYVHKKNQANTLCFLCLLNKESYHRKIRLIKTGEGRIGKEIGDLYLEIRLVTSEGF